MLIAVAGGTGAAGGKIVGAVVAAGHEAVVLARSTGVDVTTGAGLDDALRGVSVLIDASNRTTVRRRASVAFFTTSTQHLLDAEKRGAKCSSLTMRWRASGLAMCGHAFGHEPF